MTWKHLCKLGRELPDVVESTWYGTAGLKVRGKGFVRLKEDGRTAVFFLESVEEQEFLVGAKPSVYFVTDHYRGWPSVLARLPRLTVAECRVRLEEAWRTKAPDALVRRYDESR